MKKILSFVFPFLYTRNWYTGEREVSPPRLALFGVMCALIVAALVVAAYLQSPVVYQAL